MLFFLRGVDNGPTFEWKACLFSSLFLSERCRRRHNGPKKHSSNHDSPAKRKKQKAVFPFLGTRSITKLKLQIETRNIEQGMPLMPLVLVST